MTLVELAGTLPTVAFTPALVQRAVELGILELSRDGISVIVQRPSFLQIGGELAALGVSVAEILYQYELLRVEIDAIAARFTGLFRRRLWKPFVKRGIPAEQVPPLVGTLEKLGPLAEQVTAMSLRHSRQQAADTFLSTDARRFGCAHCPAGRTRRHRAGLAIAPAAPEATLTRVPAC